DPIFDFEPNPDDGVIRVRIKKQLPPEWGVIIGDCIYNLRSGLDHLVWVTVLKHGGTPTSSNEFPIFLKRDPHSKVDGKGKPTRGSGLAKVEGLPDGAKACIESLQPYNRKDGPPALHPLWLLHEISNHDKHRLVNITHAAITSGIVAISGLGHGKVERFALPLGALEDGAEVARIRPMLGYDLERQVQVNFKFTPGVAFDKEGPGRGLPVADTIVAIQSFIEFQILTCLTPFIK
ncbi:MAG: hypothetical protein IIC80_02800, partial [Chloroflexi bacterium]|nr:hypothetical protein [Chloroflexota bacterium]